MFLLWVHRKNSNLGGKGVIKRELRIGYVVQPPRLASRSTNPMCPDPVPHLQGGFQLSTKHGILGLQK